MKEVIVPISLGESFQCWQWARERQYTKHPRARSKRFSYRKDDITIHYFGIIGEYAVSKAFWVPYDPKPLPFGDDGNDFTLPNGMTVQIKYRDKRGWDFALNSDDPDEFKTDIGILVYPAYEPKTLVDDVEIVGWITRDKFLEHAKIENYIKRDGGDRLAVEAELFDPVEELLKEVLAGAAY